MTLAQPIIEFSYILFINYEFIDITTQIINLRFILKSVIAAKVLIISMPMKDFILLPLLISQN